MDIKKKKHKRKFENIFGKGGNSIKIVLRYR